MSRAPRSIASWSVGNVSRIRVSSLDLAALERHVEIHADEDTLARHFQIANR